MSREMTPPALNGEDRGRTQSIKGTWVESETKHSEEMRNMSKRAWPLMHGRGGLKGTV